MAQSSSEVKDLKPGVTLGDRYLVDDKSLGEGAFGAVMLGTDTWDEKKTKYAIKKVLIDTLVSQGIERHIKNEISIMRVISHPNIVNLQDVFYSSHNLYLVLELATGGDLFTLLCPEDGSPGGPLPEKQARKFFQQLICAMEYCHNKGICHRDIKPENLLLDSNGDLKICDFGLSTLRVGKGRTTTQCGTPNYVAPEVLHTDGIYSDEYDPKPADLWTCGVMLYVFCTACLPFDSDNNAVLYRQIKAATFQWPRGVKVPPGAKDLVQKILEPNPSKRPTIEEIKADPWFQVNFTPIVGKEEKERTPRSAKSPSAKKSMNAFELLSKMESVAGMGIAGENQMYFTANKDEKAISDLVKAEISHRGFSCTLQGDNTEACEGEMAGEPLSFTFEAQPIIDEVSVVVFAHKRGNRDALYDLFCTIAEQLAEFIQGNLPQRKESSALSGDLARLSAELGK